MPVEVATRLLSANRDSIAAAARVLSQGGLVAFPTETVYGLGADAGSDSAVAGAALPKTSTDCRASSTVCPIPT